GARGPSRHPDHRFRAGGGGLSTGRLRGGSRRGPARAVGEGGARGQRAPGTALPGRLRRNAAAGVGGRRTLRHQGGAGSGRGRGGRGGGEGGGTEGGWRLRLLDVRVDVALRSSVDVTER